MAAASAGNVTTATKYAVDGSAEELSAESRHESSRQREEHLDEHLERCAPLRARDKHAGCIGVKRPRGTPGDERAGSEQEENAGEGNTADTKSDECLGLVAEAFAEELDLLRRDEHFGGSARDIAAMADMMRCLSDGFDATEQQLFLENKTR